MLDNGHGNLVILFRQLERRISIEKIVIRHGLAVQDLSTRYGWFRRMQLSIEGPLLMRVFPVAEHRCPFKLQGQYFGKLDLTALDLLLKIPGDQTVVACSVLKHLHCQLAP